MSGKVYSADRDGSGPVSDAKVEQTAKIPLKNVEHGKKFQQSENGSIFTNIGSPINAYSHGVFDEAGWDSLARCKRYGDMYRPSAMEPSEVEQPVSRKFLVVDPVVKTTTAVFIANLRGGGRVHTATRLFVAKNETNTGDMLFSLAQNKELSFTTLVSGRAGDLVVGGAKAPTEIEPAKRAGVPFDANHSGFKILSAFLSEKDTKGPNRIFPVDSRDFSTKEEFYRAVAQYLDASPVPFPLVVGEFNRNEGGRNILAISREQSFIDDTSGARYLLWIDDSPEQK